MTNQTQVTDRVLLCDVHTTLSENYLRKKLLKTYRGITHVERWHHIDEDKIKTPKELVQIDFISPKYAADFLQKGFIVIDSLRCRVKTLKPSRRLQNHNGFDSQSNSFIDKQQITNRILVHDVPTKISEDEFKQELSKVYSGIENVKRWYGTNESKTPTERVQVNFISSENTLTILENGFIEVGQYCWPVTALKPRLYLQSELESDRGSDRQSEIFSEEEQVTDKILVYNVPITINENDFHRKLSETYSGIKQIKRWYFNDPSQSPMTRVQINFISPKHTEGILRDRCIINGNASYKIKALKPSLYLQAEFQSDSESNYQSEMFTEEQILQIFEEQKQKLNELISDFDTQLNNRISSSAQ